MRSQVSWSVCLSVCLFLTSRCLCLCLSVCLCLFLGLSICLHSLPPSVSPPIPPSLLSSPSYPESPKVTPVEWFLQVSLFLEKNLLYPLSFLFALNLSALHYKARFGD